MVLVYWYSTYVLVWLGLAWYGMVECKVHYFIYTKYISYILLGYLHPRANLNSIGLFEKKTTPPQPFYLNKNMNTPISTSIQTENRCPNSEFVFSIKGE